MIVTRRVLAVRAWPLDRKQKVLEELEHLVNLPKHSTRPVCSAFLAQLDEASLQFDQLGIEEARQVLGLDK